MKKYIIGFIIIMSLSFTDKAQAQFYSVSTNTVALATGTLNVEGGLSIHRNWSLHLPVHYNPLKLKDVRLQTLTVSPAVRYWFLETFARNFVSLQALYTRYHVGVKDVTEFRYDGHGYGLGASYGYSKVLNKRWNFEFEVGVGLLYADYTKYNHKKCSRPLGKEQKLKIIPSRVSLNFVHLF